MIDVTTLMIRFLGKMLQTVLSALLPVNVLFKILIIQIKRPILCTLEIISTTDNRKEIEILVSFSQAFSFGCIRRWLWTIIFSILNKFLGISVGYKLEFYRMRNFSNILEYFCRDVVFDDNRNLLKLRSTN